MQSQSVLDTFVSCGRPAQLAAVGRKAMAKDYTNLTVGDVLTAFHETREAIMRAEALLEKVSELARLMQRFGGSAVVGGVFG